VTLLLRYPSFLALAVGCVPSEGPSRRELTELVTDHVLGHVHRNELVAVVHHDVGADELRKNRGATRPGLDGAAALVPLRAFHFVEQMMVDERTFFDRAGHGLLLPPRNDVDVGALVVAGTGPFGRPTPRRARVTAAGGAAFTTAHRVVDGVHRRTAVVRATAEPAGLAGLAVVDVAVLGVAEHAHRRAAVGVDTAHFARRHADQ